MIHLHLKGTDIQNVSKTPFTTMNIKFYVREYVNKNGTAQIYLSISSQGVRKRIPVDIYINPNDWDTTKQRAKAKTENADTINLLLEHLSSKIYDIKIRYRLANLNLSVDMLIDELNSESSATLDFISFMKSYLNECVLTKGSRSKNLSEIKKLQEFRPVIYFKDINLQFVDKYRHWLHSEKKNAPTTIAYSLKTLLKYIRVAQKYGYSINLDTDMVRPGSTKGNRVNLNIEEVNKLKAYYESEFIKEEYKLALGYFLFSCYTSLRISDIRNLKREDVMGEAIHFHIQKTKKIHTIPLNNTAKSIINHYPKLFEDWKTEQKMNLSLKKVASICGIKKKIHFHVGRHSFATNFLRKGGKIEDLQVIMGHSDIKTTMVYVHMVKAESVKSIYLMD